MVGAQVARSDAGLRFVKPPPTCGQCADHPECLGVESGYLAAHGGEFTVAAGPREPPRPDIDALRALLAAVVIEDSDRPAPDAGPGSAPREPSPPPPAAVETRATELPDHAPAERAAPPPAPVQTCAAAVTDHARAGWAAPLPAAWQTRAAELLDHSRVGRGAPLAGYAVRELTLAPGKVLLRMESAADAMELYLELKADAARYFKIGRRLAVSYLPATPPDTPARLRLVGALLRLLDGHV